MAPGWEVVDRALAFDGSPWLRVWREAVRLPSGRVVSPWYTLEKADIAVCVPVLDDGRVLLLRVYRHGLRGVTLDLPGGHVDRGEAPEEAARRELLEETGHEAREWTRLAAVTIDGNRGAGRCHVFLARGAREVAAPAEDDTEAGERVLVGVDGLEELLREGAFGTMVPALAVSLALGELRRPGSGE